MFTEVLGSHIATVRPTLWVTIGALLWTLWNIRNKFVIEHVIPLRATDAIFKLRGFLQLWQPLTRRNDRHSIDTAVAALRSVAARMSSAPTPLPRPPREPD